MELDVGDAQAWEALAAAVRGQGKSLTALVNNAGITGPRNTVTHTVLEDWERVMRINLTGAMLGIRALAPLMPRGGAIVNTASINGLVGNATQPAYVAGKHGVVGLTRHAALKHARHGIRVNAVCPGVIETPMTDSVAANPGIRKIMENMTPMGRMGQPEEIASAVLWLCSDQASFVTGHAMVIDGGATAI